ncbi:MAG: radical SAM protein, partial [Bacteroidota bacterium]
ADGAGWDYDSTQSSGGPEEGVHMLNHGDILTYEEILEVIAVTVQMGITKVRITGGEPLVRKGIVHFVERVAAIEGILDLAMTTNGILLSGFAGDLARAGLHRINISLDTIDPLKYREITRGGDILQVFEGIREAKKAGLLPIKINCVVRQSSGEPDAMNVKDFCLKNGLEVRFIHEMNLANGCFTMVENGHGGDCPNCNRLRLTANGLIRPCLFDASGFSIREYGIRKALELALEMKPERGTVNLNGKFHNIGG